MTFKQHLPTLLALAVALAHPVAALAQSPVAPVGYSGGDGAQQRAQQENFKSVLTRDQVRAELAQAQREGQLARGDGAMERALFADFKSTLTRAQVMAEAREARRLGVLQPRYDGETVLPTPAQAEAIRQAGLRAIGAEHLAERR
jgi:Domain of unknown function (DUF4148)